MVGPSYRKNKRLISGGGEREEKADIDTTVNKKTKIRRSQIFCAGIEPPAMNMSSLRHQVEVGNDSDLKVSEQQDRVSRDFS